MCIHGIATGNAMSRYLLSWQGVLSVERTYYAAQHMQQVQGQCYLRLRLQGIMCIHAIATGNAVSHRLLSWQEVYLLTEHIALHRTCNKSRDHVTCGRTANQQSRLTK